MDYLESAEGIDISYDRAYHEIERHCLADWDSLKDFNRECWNVYASGGTISAVRVLHWLGH